ncbi:hypothetical protein SNE40_019428 [Patella caerulea]|uniref:Uncharacterized protein n=1 Tax=Patella caerulea TaxID=87958 RepID=A0AAN8J6H1_PATCE
MEFHCVFEDCSMEEVVVTEEVVETNNGYEADVDDVDDGYEEEWMFGDEEWLVSDPFLCEMDQEVYSWLYEEAFRPNVSSTPVRPTTPPPPASIFQPFDDIETLKSWYQPGSATPPPTPSRKHKLYEDDDDEDDDPIMRHVRRRLV